MTYESHLEAEIMVKYQETCSVGTSTWKTACALKIAFFPLLSTSKIYTVLTCWKKCGHTPAQKPGADKGFRDADIK